MALLQQAVFRLDPAELLQHGMGSQQQREHGGQGMHGVYRAGRRDRWPPPKPG